MKKNRRILLFMAVLLLLASASPLFSQEGDIVGAGIILGEPTGISAKVWFEKGLAADAAVAWSFLGDSSLYVHGNFLYHFKVLNTGADNFITPYVSARAAFRFEDYLNVGLRVPVGVSWLLNAAPVEVFAEIAPGVGLVPETDLELGVGLGARFYFPL